MAIVIDACPVARDRRRRGTTASAGARHPPPPRVAVVVSVIVSILVIGGVGTLRGPIRPVVAESSPSRRYRDECHHFLSSPSRSSRGIADGGMVRCHGDDGEYHDDGMRIPMGGPILLTPMMSSREKTTDDPVPRAQVALARCGSRKRGRKMGEGGGASSWGGIISILVGGGGWGEGTSEDDEGDEDEGEATTNIAIPDVSRDDDVNSSSTKRASLRDDDSDEGVNPPYDDDSGIISYHVNRAYCSFLSWFRYSTTEESGGGSRRRPDDDARSITTPDISGIAHRMPHGSDGRGGGGGESASTAMVDARHDTTRGAMEGSSTMERSRMKGEKFAITTTAEIVDVSTSTNCAVDVDELGTDVHSSSPEKPRVGTTRASTAFVEPPPRQHSTSSSSSTETGNRDDTKEQSKSSKIELSGEGEVYDDDAIIRSPNITTARNHTNMTTSVSGAVTTAGEISDDFQPHNRKDYISSGYVSSSAPQYLDSRLHFLSQMANITLSQITDPSITNYRSGSG
jgi:hypothetical protein